MPRVDDVDPASQRPLPRRRAAHAGVLCGALIGATLIIAGCGGGSSSPGVASVASSTTVSSSSASSAGAGGGAIGGGGGTAASSGVPSGAHVGFAIAGAGGANLLKFASCMRANGVPNFPDPNAQGVIQGSGINPQSPQFQAASQKCQRYQGKGAALSPAQQQALATQGLAFSHCMRSHGVPDFPDPQTRGGGVRFRIGGPGSKSELNPSSPIFQKAQRDCQSDLPGIPGKVGPPPAFGG